MRIHTLVMQAAATSVTVAVGGLAIVAGRSWGPRFLNAAVLVEATLLTILALAYRTHREHVLRLIAEGGERLPLDEVSLEVERLQRPRCTRELARQLERALENAARCYQAPTGSPQGQGIRPLSGSLSDVRAIINSLQREVAPPAGLARLTLMLRGADESALSAGDSDTFRGKLAAVDQLLSMSLSSPGTVGRRREESHRHRRAD